MSGYNFKESNGCYIDPPDIIITESACRIILQIEEILDYLISRKNISHVDDEIYFKFRELADIYDLLQQDVLESSKIIPVCKKGCVHCCCHWVENVSSLEAAVISRYLKENYPETITRLIRKFREDTVIFDSLCGSAGMTDENQIVSGEYDDGYDLLLSRFYQLERQCALMDKSGRCMVYPVRPFTCRDYFNIRDKNFCHPLKINNDNNATLIVYISDSITEKLEALHRRFDEGSDNMSLRRIMVPFLEEGL